MLSTHDLNGIAAHLPRVVCLNRRVIGDGVPHDVLTADVLERTYGASMEVLVHGGMPVVVDNFRHHPPHAHPHPHPHGDADAHVHAHVHGEAHAHAEVPR